MSVLSQTRREFLRRTALAGLGAALGGRLAGAAAARPNVVILTADDLNFDSLGVTGGPIRDLTPNLDRLAAQGMRFAHAYSTVAVCQPVREIMHTGLYPHRNGAMGFFPIRREVRTLNEQLHDAGYLISMVGGKWFTMRCVRTRRDAYIWNAWSDGRTRYQAENMNGISWRAMLQAAETNPEIRKRVDFYLYRVPEEFYELEGDLCERRNLIDSRAHRRRIEAMRGQLLELLRRTSDPFAEAFARRGDPAVLRETMAKLDAEYPPPRRPARPGGKKRRPHAIDPEE